MDPAAPCLIVGAGPAGLAQARAFMRAGIPFELVERHSGPGGIWDIENPGSPMYGSARLISSKGRSAFLGFPMPRDYPDYPDHRRVLAYLTDFARAEGLLDRIAFGTEVIRIENAGEDLWRATLSSGENRVYGAVVCANGMTWYPQLPEIPGRFAGRVSHAVGYRESTAFEGKRVLVIGGGNTGCDVACDLAQAGVATALSLRRGYHVVPRHILGLPADVVGAGLPGVPIRLQQGVSQGLLRLLRGDPARRGWPRPDHRIFESHPIINSQILELVGRGVDRVTSRACLTSLSTMVPAWTILAVGLAPLADFAQVMIVGTLAGTFSSLFIVGSFAVRALERPSRPRVTEPAAAMS